MFVIRHRLEPLLRRLDGINKLIERVLDPYRPELHYMRGPGPKWHARHGAVLGGKPVETAA